MSKGARGDVARQVAVVLGAIFQIAVPLFTGPAVGRVSERTRRSWCRLTTHSSSGPPSSFWL